MTDQSDNGLGKQQCLFADWPLTDKVTALTTTRMGGVSQSPWDSFNLAAHVGDDIQAVEENRRRLQSMLDLPSSTQWLEQVHGDQVIRLPCETPVASDASYTQQRGEVCAVLTADCLPLLIANAEGDEVAAVHAGWRGLAAGVIQNAIQSFNSQPDQLFIWLGPAIGPESFEVGHEVYEAFTDIDPQNQQAFKKHQGRWLCDLYELARMRLNKLGVQQIYGGEHCTYQESSRFYSYRRDGQTGRMASLIWVNP